MKFKSPLAWAILPAIAFSSCLSSSDEPQNEATYSYGGQSCFNLVTDIQTGETKTYDGPNYSLHYDFTAQNTKVEITGLKLSADLSGLSFKLPLMPLTIETSSQLYLTKASNVTPENAAGAYVFNNFNLRANPVRAIMQGTSYRIYPVYQVNYVINSRYEVTTFPVQNAFVGTTVATHTDAEGSVNSYTDRQTNFFVVEINHEKMTADLKIPALKVTESSPSQAFQVKDIPVTLNAGGFLISPQGDDVTYPVLNTSGKPIENCSLSGLRVASTLDTGATAISFKAVLTGLSSGAYEFGVYNISASLGYYYPQNNDDSNKPK